jgi:hypothetical protein
LPCSGPSDVNLMGSRGMVETDLIPSDPQSGSQAMLADAAVSERLNIREPGPGENIEQEASEKVTGKFENIDQAKDQIPSPLAEVKAGVLKGSEQTGDPTTLESNGMACMHSSADRNKSLRSMFAFHEHRLSMCGIIGLLLGTAVALRRKKPAIVAKATIR